MRLKSLFKSNFIPTSVKQHSLTALLVLVVAFQAFQVISSQGTRGVLGYATNINITQLLNITNQNRAANGLASLALNGKLNAAAQGKANHMVANDYWSHFAPDGTSPWFFFNSAGYQYSKAGENLAYGFSNSSAVMTGWMNSPPHAANVLDAGFTEVGFASTDGANFQGGENTVVVAMYGTPTGVSTPPPPPEPEPEPEPQPPATSQQSNSQTPTNTPAAQATPTASTSAPAEIADTAETTPDETSETEATPDQTTDEESRIINSQYTLTRLDEDATIDGVNGTAVVPESKRISTLDILLTGDAEPSMYITIGALSLLTMVYIVRHTKAIYQFVVRGEHFIVGHPLLEAGLIYAALWLILISTYGVIQ